MQKKYKLTQCLPVNVPWPPPGCSSVVLFEVTKEGLPSLKIVFVSAGEIDNIYEGLLNDA